MIPDEDLIITWARPSADIILTSSRWVRARKRNSSALAMELRLSCANPSICYVVEYHMAMLSGLILGLHPANERRRYFVTTSLIDSLTVRKPRISPGFIFGFFLYQLCWNLVLCVLRWPVYHILHVIFVKQKKRFLLNSINKIPFCHPLPINVCIYYLTGVVSFFNFFIYEFGHICTFL